MPTPLRENECLVAAWTVFVSARQTCLLVLSPPLVVNARFCVSLFDASDDVDVVTQSEPVMIPVTFEQPFCGRRAILTQSSLPLRVLQKVLNNRLEYEDGVLVLGNAAVDLHDQMEPTPCIARDVLTRELRMTEGTFDFENDSDVSTCSER